MKKLLLLITGLILLFNLDGQILRYSNYIAPPPSGGLDTAGLNALLTDGNTKGWYNIGDGSATYVTKDGSNVVSAWIDLIGTNDLTQATSDNRPVYSSSGITFDGSNDLLSASFTYANPQVVYIRFKQITFTNADGIFDGITDASMGLWQNGSSPNLSLFIAGAVADNTDLALDTFGVVRVIYNPDGGSIRVNNETATTGGEVSTGTSGGFSLGDSGAFGASNIQVQEVILRAVVDSSGDDELIMTYMMRDL